MGYTPKKENKFRIECPFKFSVPELGIDCIQEHCALFMPIQRACAFNVLARVKTKPEIQ